MKRQQVPKPARVFSVCPHRPTPLGAFTTPVIIPIHQNCNTEQVLNSCKTVLLPQVSLHDSSLWLTSSIQLLLLHDSLLSAFWGYNPKHHTQMAAASTDLLRTADNWSYFTQRWLTKPFCIPATASLVWVFLQLSNKSARHIVLIFFCKPASRTVAIHPFTCSSSQNLVFYEKS